MKVLMLNTFDEMGGAARAAVRLQQGVQQLGIDVPLLVQFKTGQGRDVICSHSKLRSLARRVKIFLGTLPVRRYPSKPEINFTPAQLPDHLLAEIAAIDPDIIHLHWLGAGFLRLETLRKLNRPLIWTLHDSWAFTGGCHVPFSCAKYRQNCGACPVLGSSCEEDLSRRIWERKNRAWRGLDLALVTPSRWLADCARSSSLFRNSRVEVIPNGLNIGIFQPLDKDFSRKSLDLPRDRKIILFGAVLGGADPNKGFPLLAQALHILGEKFTDAMVLAFGSVDFFGQPDPGMPVIGLGLVQDDQKLAAIYSAADVFVAPSLLENLPNTVLEAMACGTPCVAFQQGGVPDLIEHEVSGYLARPYATDDLARGIAWVLEDRSRHAELSRQARQKVVEEFELNHVSQRYLAMYHELLERRSAAAGSGKSTYLGE